MKTKSKTEVKAKRRPLRVLIIVFLSLVLCFGAVFGIIAAVRNAKAVMKYGSVYLSEGVANYLAATYKTSFKRELEKELKISIYDTPEFWEREYKDGKSYGDVLRDKTESYIRQVVAGAYLFDRYTTLTSDEKKAIKKAAEEKLEYRYNSDKNAFNESVGKMGFDYSDFKEATEMLYKYSRAQSAIYGTEGEVLSSSTAYLGQCDRYYGTYSHVKLLFIRTESEYMTDENGNRVTENGKDKTEPLNSADKAERLADISAIAAAIEALKNGENMQMTPLLFDTYLEKYSYDVEFDKGGYYFAPDSAYTALYLNNEEGIDDYKEIAETALTMSEGEYAKVQYGDGICFIYKYEREERAYTISRYSEFFEDFYSLAADYLYFESLKVIAAEVDVRESYYSIDPAFIPYNADIIAKVEG